MFSLIDKFVGIPIDPWPESMLVAAMIPLLLSATPKTVVPMLIALIELSTVTGTLSVMLFLALIPAPNT